MSHLNLKASAGVDPSTPFFAGTYYTGLRAEGCDPVIRDGGLHMLLNGASEFGAWAALHDPDGSARLEYARAAWAARTSNDEIILLGAG